jgi:hypothetical protein
VAFYGSLYLNASSLLALRDPIRGLPAWPRSEALSADAFPHELNRLPYSLAARFRRPVRIQLPR